MVQSPPACTRFWVSCDYGTRNPCSMGLWGERGSRWYRLREYYLRFPPEGRCRTDEEHYRALEQLCSDSRIEGVIVDPSAAASSSACAGTESTGCSRPTTGCWRASRRSPRCCRRGNCSLVRIARTASGSFRSIAGARRAAGKSRSKENDHAMDDIRYLPCRCAGKSAADFSPSPSRRGTAGAQSTNKGGR